MLENYTITAPDPLILEKAAHAVDAKTKPPGSLGRIEQLAIQLAGIQATLEPVVDPARLFIFAGDHGLTEEGVSAWPSEVTGQMVLNFLSGGAAANVFARTNGVDISIVDAGIVSTIDHPDLIKANIKSGTNNALKQDAMSLAEAEAALKFGAEQAVKAISEGAKTILLGEMGIGNTSSATLLTHKLADIDIAALTGRGAGLDDDGLAKKVDILTRTAKRRAEKLSPIEALIAFGGLEIAAMTGALIGAASKGAVVLVDGFIASSAALIALKARPEATAYTIFAHRSKEPGHQLILEALNSEPLLDLDLRLGEGTGALLAFPLLKNACAMLKEMATFESAGVSGKSDA